MCVSETVKRNFNNIFKVNAPVDVLYNTVETEVIRRNSEELIEDIQFNPEEINIISVAKLIKSKGYDSLVRVQKKLRDDGFKTHVYIVGKGEEQNHLQKLVEENHIKDSWTFVGFKSNPYKYVNITVRQSRQSGVARATCPD